MTSNSPQHATSPRPVSVDARATGPAPHIDTTGAYLVLLPCLDDWESVRALMPLLDGALTRAGLRARILIVDDGSQESPPPDLISATLDAISRVDVLVLLRNLGHQRAICVGLCHVVNDPELRECAGVVVMDADGEDSPDDVPRLIEQFRAARGERAIFARRMRRSEGAAFRFFYWLYRRLHLLLTGIPVQIGNFSVLPVPLARRLTVVSELWNHYAAAAVQSRIPIDQLPAARAPRLAGASRMHFVSLVGHGLGAMSVFADRIGVRALLVTVALMVVFTTGMIAIAAIRFLTALAIPGWATTAMGIFALLLMQSLLLSLVFVFLIHLGRAGSGFLPAREYSWFVDRVTTLWRGDERV